MANPRTIAYSQQNPASRRSYDDVLLNRYRIMSSCGTGGFGTVLACWDTRLQRRVAIKRLPLGTTGAASTLQEALGEARTSSMLRSAHIANASMRAEVSPCPRREGGWSQSVSKK